MDHESLDLHWPNRCGHADCVEREPRFERVLALVHLSTGRVFRGPNKGLKVVLGLVTSNRGVALTRTEYASVLGWHKCLGKLTIVGGADLIARVLSLNQEYT